jgi:hypothetical protein
MADRGRQGRKALVALLVLAISGAGVFAWREFAGPGPPAPDAYARWLAVPGHAEGLARYRAYLDAQGVGDVLPPRQLLSATRDGPRCGRAAWQLPPAELWPRVVPTLRLLRRLREQRVLGAFEVMSSYRDPQLNRCAGGRPQSRHLDNAAFDLRLPDGADRDRRLAALCDWWKRNGIGYGFGLGFYPSGNLHVDTRGFRTWGSDFSATSSPCR